MSNEAQRIIDGLEYQAPIPNVALSVSDLSLSTPELASLYSLRRGVRASAGSGKTYELTSYYLRVLLQGADPGSILATTFTRKAAGEILGRIMERLANACESDTAFATMRQELDLPDLDREQAQVCLKRLCHNLHQVSISTIDSFFGKLLRCFSHDLGIASGTRMLTEDSAEVSEIRREAIRRLLQSNEEQNLPILLGSLYKGKTKRAIASSLEEQLTEAHEIFLTTTEKQWQPNFALAGKLNLSDLKSVIQQLEAVEMDGFTDAFKKTVWKDIDNARETKWIEFLAKGLPSKIKVGEFIYNRKPIPDSLIEVYEPLVAHAKVAILDEHVRHTLALYELLERYNCHFQELCRQRKVMLFREVPLRLKALLNGEFGEESAHRLDARIERLLLDEFQDTDPQQYAILKPFADRIHALPDEEGLLFCVGDMKQSIYGWRGATPEIFERIGVDLPAMTWKENDVSYRSSQVILDAVNHIFSRLSDNEILKEKCHRIIGDWEGVFRPHKAKKSLSGFFEVTETITDEAVGEQEETDPGDHSISTSLDDHLKFVAQRVQKIASQTPQKTVGILLRGNAMVHAMVAELHKLGISASAEGGSLIATDPAVAVVLSALHLADHPADSAAAFHVMNSPLAPIYGFPQKAPQQVAAMIRHSLMERGYSRYLEELALQLSPHVDEQGARRLTQLLELADEFGAESGTRPTEFVKFVKSRTLEEPSSDLVRVMTIHKSKGLEFDVVVLPELHKKISVQVKPLYQRDEGGNITCVSIYPKEAIRDIETKLRELYESVEDRLHRESLCSLYVAMTRARRALHIFLPAKKDSLTLATILKHGLQSDSVTLADGEDKCIYRAGDPRWWEQDADEVQTDSVTYELLDSPIEIVNSNVLARRGFPQINPSEVGHNSKQSAEQLLGIEDSPSKRRGTVLHALLSHVAWKDELWLCEMEPVQIARFAAKGINDEEVRTYLNEFDTICKNPIFLQSITKPALDGGESIDLWMERGFACLVEGNLISGQFDRVVVIRSHGLPVSAKIIDYKSDRVKATDIPAYAERYKPQLCLYRQALSNMLNLEPQKISAAMLFTTSGTLVPVD